MFRMVLHCFYVIMHYYIFQDIPNGQLSSCDIGSSPDNIKKNRFKNIFACNIDETYPSLKLSHVSFSCASTISLLSSICVIFR